MPWIRISEFESNGGANRDLPPQMLPPNVCSEASNVTFREGTIEKVKGWDDFYANPSIAPYYLVSVQSSSDAWFLAAGRNKIHRYASSAFADVTRASGGDYSSGDGNFWTGGVLHGVPFLNNQNDLPQSWDSGTSKMVNLPNWNANYKAGALRAFRNYLIAMDITKTGTRYPHNVLWSHPADPGTAPSSWDTADPTKDAGETTLSETAGFVLDGGAIGNQFAIYKEDSMYAVQWTGAPYILNFRPVIKEAGMLARDCYAEVLSSHVVITTEDVGLFDGQQFKSIVNRRWRRHIFSKITGENYQKTFVVAMPHLSEVWVCIAEVSGQYATKAFVWNWRNDSWSERDLPNVQHIIRAFAPADPAASWDSDSGSWDSDASEWAGYSGGAKLDLFASPANTAIYVGNRGETGLGTPFTAKMQHDSFDFASDRAPGLQDKIKHISKIRPRVVAPAGTVLSVEVGTQMHVDDTIDWGVAQNFTVGTDEELCWTRNGRYISWRVSSNTDCTWRLEALDILMQAGGVY